MNKKINKKKKQKKKQKIKISIIKIRCLELWYYVMGIV